MPGQPFEPGSFTSFGDLLKYLRRRARLTQLELSIAVGYSESQISRLEQNQRLPDIAALKALFVPALLLEEQPEITKRLVELARSAGQEELPAEGAAPYKGLLFFDEPDAALFFGRELLSAKLAKRVLDLATEPSPRFLAVVGASGSGKSSLLRAGLTVALRAEGWDIRIFTPTASPLKALNTELDLMHREPHSEQKCLIVDQFEEAFTLCSQERERSAFIDRLLSLAKDRVEKTVVVIALRADFYSHCAQYPHLRKAVAAQQEYIGQMTKEELRRAIEEPAKRGSWEFEPGLVELLLKDIGVEGLEDPEPGALPLLSHALLAVWERRRGRMLTLRGYEQSGRVRGAIAQTAENVFSDQLNQKQQQLAHNIFLRLTELGQGTADTRRRASLNELVSRSQQTAELRSVLNTLAQARLITLSEDSAEVAHEALIREWQRLHEWLTRDREGLVLHRHLTGAAREWEILGRDPGSLYRGARLSQAREWAQANAERMNTIESEFLSASCEQEERESRERESRRQNELEAAKRLAETEHKSAVRLQARNRMITVVSALAVILAGLAALYGLRLRSAFMRAEAQRLAAEANSLYKSNGSSELIALLALRSMKIQYSPEGDEALARAAGMIYPLQMYGGHTKLLWGTAFSPDGKYVLTGSEDGTARLWDRRSGRQVQQFDCSGVTYQVAFAPDGQAAMTNCGDTSIRLWDPETGERLQTFRNSDFVDMPVFSRDGQSVLAAARDSIVRVWDVKTGKMVQQFVVPVSSRSRLFVSSDAKYVLTQRFSDDSVQLWSLDETVKRLWSLPYKEGAYAFSVAFSPDGAYVLLGHLDGSIGVWSTASGRQVQRLEGHTSAVTSITFSADGRLVLTGSGDKTVRLWDWQKGVELLRLGQSDQVYASALSPDGRYILAGSRDGTASLWDTRSRPELPSFSGNGGILSAIAFSPDGKLLATGGSAGLQLWEAGSGKLMRTFPGMGSINYGVRFSPDGRYLLSGNWAGAVVLWEISTGRKVHEFVLQTSTSSGINDVAFSPDGKHILAGGFTDSIFPSTQVWDLASEETVLGSFVEHVTYDSISRVAFSPDGRFMLTAHQRGQVSVWDAHNGKLVRELTGHTGSVNGLAISPDGKYVATAGDDKTARLWDFETGEEIRQLTGHSELLWSVAFSEDGRILATTSADGTSRLWDVETGEELRRLVGHAAGVENAAFSPDGAILATSSDDGTARLWDVDFQNTTRFLCSQLLRDLTDAERKQYNITEPAPSCPTP